MTLRDLWPRAAILAFLIHPGANAQVFRWVDSQGVVHYGDKPPDGVKAVAPDIRIPKTEASRDVEVKETLIEWFEVRGMSIRDINATMRATAPKDKEGKPRWGQAPWNLKWKFRHAQSGEQCRIGEFTVIVNTTLRLPKWVDQPNALPGLQKSWETFTKALRIHEEGHRDNAIRAGNDLARRLRALQPYPNCEALNQEITRVGTRIISEYQMVDQAYDRGTEHGVSQGAVLR